MPNTMRGCKSTQLDRSASSVYFQVAHQPRVETLAAAAASQEPIPAGFALVTQTHTHSHPRIGKNLFFVERISFALQAPQHYLPLKAFCVPIFKEAKGKTQAIHLPFVLSSSPFTSHNGFFHVTANDDSQKAPFQLFAVSLIALP